MKIAVKGVLKFHMGGMYMTENLPDLPEGWVWTRLGNITLPSNDGFTDGNWILSKNMTNEKKDVRLIQLSDIGCGYFLNKSDKWITEETYQELSCYPLIPGDILISRMAHPLARAAIFPTMHYKCITAVDVSIARIDRDFFQPKYFLWLLNSLLIQNQAEEVASGTTRKRISRKRYQDIWGQGYQYNQFCCEHRCGCKCSIKSNI